MEDAKSIIKESCDTVNELLRAPNNNKMEKLQYKLMAFNLNYLLYVVTRLQKMRQPKKTR